MDYIQNRFWKYVPRTQVPSSDPDTSMINLQSYINYGSDKNSHDNSL